MRKLANAAALAVGAHLLAPVGVLAHGGHAGPHGPPFGVWHLLVERPWFALVLVLFALAAVAAVRGWGRDPA